MFSRPLALDARPAPPTRLERAQAMLRDARELERGGRISEAAASYAAVVEACDERETGAVLAEALRRQGVLYRRRHELERAESLCRRSHDVALALGDGVLAAEALNALALVDLERGEWDRARSLLGNAISLGMDSAELRGRIEQNLGVMANIQGNLRVALAHYQRSLEAFRASRDDRGCAIAYHNLGMISADERQWAEADEYFRASLDIADASGDVYLRGLNLLNRTEVHLARQRYEEARYSVEEALQIFDRLGSRDNKSGAYKFLGVLYRETGNAALAEARLRAAIDLAREAGATLEEAEASREMALLYQTLGRNQDALKLLNASHRMFRRLDARVDLVDVAAKMTHLEGVYLAIVREWGRSIESNDSYTFGHSERVATYGARLAAALGLDDAEMTTVRIGAYLHDLGKVRVPHEILNKPGRLTPEEFEIMKQHPVYGIEMLAGVDFPWDITPIIRSHHEKLDGTGYPDRLRGDEIPLAAQLICAVDVYDALTTTRSYRGAMSHADALAEMRRSERWWRGEVFAGFLESLGREARAAA
jgi:putative nucleotidyltransferase with HDIG domain